MKEYDVYVPLYYNDGSSIEKRKFYWLRDRLLEKFDGLTYFPQPNEGYWTMGDVTSITKSRVGRNKYHPTN